MIRVAIWAAVSSRAQVENKDSLASQLRDGRLWADQVDGQVTHTFEVPGHSRQYIFFHDAEAAIPAYGELRRACERREVDVLWCRSRDRLGRTDALIAQVEALVANAGATVYSALMPTPISVIARSAATKQSPTSIYMSAIERAQSEVEQIQRVRRTRIGHRARVRDGLPHGGPPPYGYEYARNQQGDVVRLVPNDSEAGAVRLIADRYINGWGITRIIQSLNDSPYRPRRADRWARTTVRQILANPIYAGRVHYGDELVVKSDKVDPLWDEATYRALLRERASRDPGGREIATALSGIVFCGRCGRAMVHGRNPHYEYYRCTTHAHRSYTGVPCHPNCTAQDAIARALGHALSEALSPAPQGGPDVDALTQSSTPDLQRLQADRERLEGQLTATNAKRKRLAIAFADGTMDAGPYRAADDELVEDLERILSAIANIDQRLIALPTPEERQAALEELQRYWIESETEWILREDYKHELNALLRRLGVRIVCEDNNVTTVTFLG